MVLRRWRDGTVRDVYAEFNRLTLRVTLEALFGARLAAGDESAGREITGGSCSAGISLVGTLEALFGARLAAGDESVGREITGGCCSAGCTPAGKARWLVGLLNNSGKWCAQA